VNNLAVLLSSKGDYAVALPLYERALEAFERVLGPEHPFYTDEREQHSRIANSKGNDVGALPLFERVLEARERVLGRSIPIH